jgi:hypothetical protein
MGKTSRVKGAAYERALAKLFREYGFDNAKRHLEFQSEEADEGRDLDGTQPFAVQAKCWKSTPSIEALNQIKPNDEYPIPVAILKRTQVKGKPGLEVAVLPLDVFMRLVSTLAYYGCHLYSIDEDVDWDYISGKTQELYDAGKPYANCMSECKACDRRDDCEFKED